MNSCVQRNFESREQHLSSPIHISRYEVLKSFIGKSKRVVDVGCGAFVPIELNIMDACDINKNAGKYLKKLKWKGKFKEASVTDLPYKDKEFDKAICSEVIEHLRNKEDVVKAFNELNRVANKWLVTTPAAYDRDPDHTFHFGYNDDNLFNFISSEIDFTIVRKGYYFYISNDKDKLCKITGAK